MANKVEVSNLSNLSLIDRQSRYMPSKVLYYGDKRFITFETYKRKAFKSSPDDRMYVITKGTEYRPDLVSLRSYGTVSFWWKILEANNMKDIFEFKAGTNIIVPSSLP